MVPSPIHPNSQEGGRWGYGKCYFERWHKAAAYYRSEIELSNGRAVF